MSFARRAYAIRPKEFYLNKEAMADNKFMNPTNMPLTEQKETFEK